MINWIFDLDYTLYSIPKNIEFDYKYLKNDPELRNLLENLIGRKILFTNGNVHHSVSCMNIMGLKKIFHKILCRELTGFKPRLNSYIRLYHITKIPVKEKVVFFEDTPINLEMAKKFGWITVLIDRDGYFSKKNYIDFIFPCVKTAIYYLHNNLTF
jgi:FMN phosphatase YigB (HAD superfamily)